MLVFPNCKINLGLNVTEKRNDGFHNIETIFYPVQWCDALEVIENTNGKTAFEFSSSGKVINGSVESNLVYKAYNLIRAQYHLPSIKVHLHKNIPMGAGLGGGSSDAAYFITLINEKYNLNLSKSDQLQLANQLGSDCAFFIKNKPVYAVEKGTVFSECNVDLSAYYILVVYPSVHSNTKEAYDGIIPSKPLYSPKHIVENNPIKNWKDLLVNDFEHSLFKKYPLIRELKNNMYHQGALYASLSGSGSAVFGIFDHKPSTTHFKTFESFLQSPIPIHL